MRLCGGVPRYLNRSLFRAAARALVYELYVKMLAALCNHIVINSPQEIPGNYNGSVYLACAFRQAMEINFRKRFELTVQ